MNYALATHVCFGGPTERQPANSLNLVLGTEQGSALDTLLVLYHLAVTDRDWVRNREPSQWTSLRLGQESEGPTE